MKEKWKHLVLVAIPLAALILSGVMLSARMASSAKDKETLETVDTGPQYAVQVIKPGGSIFQALQDAGASVDDIARYTLFMGDYIDASKIQAGDTLKVLFAEPADSTAVARVKEIVYRPDIVVWHTFSDTGDSLAYRKDTLPYETQRRIIDGYVKQGYTLDHALAQQGFDANVRQQLIKPLEAKISFRSNAQPNDYYRALIEEYYYKGQKLPGTKVFYVSYEGKHVKRTEAFRYTEQAEDSAYNGMYSPTGEALINNSVRAPLDNIHVSSPFGYRIHPISHVRKMHEGVDYRGRTGTPVYAVADGRVTSSGRHGGYGNEVMIKHSEYSTQYAHLSKILVKRGQAVHKGQIIGRVGSTGYSTGPHLHFGVRRSGRWVNPLTNLSMVGAVELKGEKLEAFKTQMAALQAEVQAWEQQWRTLTATTK